MIILLICILVLIIIFLIIRDMKIQCSLKDITKQLEKKMSGTNILITTNTNNKEVNEFVHTLNKDLKKLRKLELQYKNGNQELEKIVTNISHDIRTPLTAIKGYLSLLEKEKLSSKERDYLQIIKEKTENIILLTEQLFDYSKCLDTKENLKKERVCMNDILENVIVSYYALLKEKNIIPKIEISKQKIYRNIDATMLMRIFENILSNAIKYTEKDLKISLLDNGEILFVNQTSSLDKISVQKIFDRYYTVENGSKNSGVGLSIAKQLVELNDGFIKATYKNKNLIIKINF